MFLEVIIRYECEFNTSVTDLKVKCKLRRKRLKNLINGWIFWILRDRFEVTMQRTQTENRMSCLFSSLSLSMSPSMPSHQMPLKKTRMTKYTVYSDQSHCAVPNTLHTIKPCLSCAIRIRARINAIPKCTQLLLVVILFWCSFGNINAASKFSKRKIHQTVSLHSSPRT